MHKCGRKSAVVVVVWAWLVAGIAVDGRAQESINHASVSGRVTDASGAVLVGTQVTARHLDTNLLSAIATDDEGRFRFPYLRVGPYEVVVSETGFTEARRVLILTAGAAFELPFALDVGGVQSAVTVSGDAPVLEAARSQIAGTVSQNEVAALPFNGRNFLDVALLVPGVAPARVGSGTQLFPETSAVQGVSLSVGSQRNLSNSFIVDGLSANDDAAALSGIAYGMDAIDQVQVVTTGGQAELGRALGGYVNVVTRSGTNAVRGNAYFYGRHDRLNARHALSGTTLPMEQAQYGLSLGGPVLRDRTFYFLNVEQKRLDQSGLVTVSPAHVAAINARLAEVGYRGPAIVTGIYPNPVDTTTSLAKIDHRLKDSDHLSVRHSLYAVTSRNSRGVGGLSAPSASAGLDNLDQTVAAGNVLALSARTVLETRAQVAYSDLAAEPTDPIGPNVSISGVASFGRLSTSPTGRRNLLYQVVNSLSHQAGSHALRAGVDLLYNDLTIVFPRAVHGSYAFSSLENFLAGRYNTSGFTQTFGTSSIALTNPNVGMHVQDEWKVAPNVTLNLGVRYDLQMLETIRTDTSNISPRVGVAWSPFASRRTIVRGSAGLFYDRVPLRALANALMSAGNTTDLTQLRQISISLSPAQTGAPVFPAALDAPVPTVTLPNLTTMDRHLQNAYSRQASLEVERQIGQATTVRAGYESLRGRNLIMAVNQNVPSCPAVQGNNGCRPNPAYANNSQYSSVGSSSFDMLYTSLVHQPSSWGSLRVSYALSKSMNDVGEAFFNQPIDPFDLSKDWARSDGDQRHRLVVAGTIGTSPALAGGLWRTLARNIRLSGMLQYYSAAPFNITSGVTTVQGTAGRPMVNGRFIERNAGTGGNFVSMNLRASRTFQAGSRTRIEGLVEVFNLLNRRNVLAVNGNFGPGAYPARSSSSFGQVTAVADPRTVQLGLRLSF